VKSKQCDISDKFVGTMKGKKKRAPLPSAGDSGKYFARRYFYM
jgi:hypothetical protein